MCDAASAVRPRHHLPFSYLAILRKPYKRQVVVSGAGLFIWMSDIIGRMNSKQPLLAIVGPTGVGKTAYALALAQHTNGALVSADSRQVFRGMDIATGKEVGRGRWVDYEGVRVLEIGGINIYGLDLLDPDGDMSVAVWLKAAHRAISLIQSQGKSPIIVGGTGFYLAALEGKIATLGIAVNPQLRQELAPVSLADLLELLQQICPDKALVIDRRNRVRLIRAIEVAKASIEAANLPRLVDSDSASLEPYRLKLVGLTMARATLYDAVDARVERMFIEGLIEETTALRRRFDTRSPAFSGIGYGETLAYLDHTLTLSAAKERIKFRTHAYIRRQETWFRAKQVDWLEAPLRSSLR
jgi:tRNA dimethylallyltransferase